MMKEESRGKLKTVHEYEKREKKEIDEEGFAMHCQQGSQP